VVVIVGLIVAIGAGVAFGGWAAYRHFTVGYVFNPPPPGGEVTVTIPEGATLKDIAARLEDAGVVTSARAFRGSVEDGGQATALRPGTYVFIAYDEHQTIIAQLVAGGDENAVRVPLPEGLDAREMGTVAKDTVEGFSRKDYLDLTIREPIPYELEGKKTEGTLEGLLFPATYEFPPLETPVDLVEGQLEQFTEKFAEVDLGRARKAGLTAYDVVIIASIIEREVQVAKERALVAAVIYNRLERDMQLQIDATVQYALGERDKVLTLDDLETDSPYNTYRVKGLPPAPICNPGLASLKAAADPADVDYLFYVVRNDGTGGHAFSSTLEQFEKDKAAAGL